MADIVIAEFMDESAVEDLRRDYDVVYDPGLVDRADDLLAAVAGCRALVVRNRTQVRGALLDAAPRLEALGRLGVGLDNIDMEACQARGIAVLPATGANDLAVAEYVIAGLLMLLRGAYHAGARVLAGEWPRTDLMGREVAGRRLGLIGFGAIGRSVASRARALGMTVAACDPYVSADDPAWAALSVEPRDFDAVVAESDALSLHVPLTDETRHLIDGKALSRMRPGAVLINAARGGVVDEDAVAAALRAGTLGGAMLDVFENEPLAAGSALDGVPNLILTPHIAGLSEDSHRRISAVTAANVRRVLEGN